MIEIPMPVPHPLKEPFRKSGLTLWQLKKMVGLKAESRLSRMLGGTQTMPQDIEDKLREILAELKQPIVSVK